MKKVFKDEKDSHFIAGLIIVACSVIGVFVFLFNLYDFVPTCPIDQPASYPCSASDVPPPNLPTVISYNTNPDQLPPAESRKYSDFKVDHVWATTTPKTVWEKNDFPTFATGDQKCFIASTTISTDFSREGYKVISFNYALCPNNSPVFNQAIEPNVVYQNWNYELNPTINGTPAFTYWNLGKGENVESFISGLIKSLPNPDQRNHCKVDSEALSKIRSPKGNSRHYTVSPDDAYIKLLGSKGEEWTGTCYPYSNYFKMVGNTLIYISNSQDASLFDPDSINISAVDTTKNPQATY